MSNTFSREAKKFLGDEAPPAPPLVTGLVRTRKHFIHEFLGFNLLLFRFHYLKDGPLIEELALIECFPSCTRCNHSLIPTIFVSSGTKTPQKML